MKICPLCGNEASIKPPEWSGGRIYIDCPECGNFSTNKITMDELVYLRAEGSTRIVELKHSVKTAEHPWYITKSQRLGLIILESGHPAEMTKRQKKQRRRASAASSSTGIHMIYHADNVSEKT